MGASTLSRPEARQASIPMGTASPWIPASRHLCHNPAVPPGQGLSRGVVRAGGMAVSMVAAVAGRSVMEASIVGRAEFWQARVHAGLPSTVGSYERTARGVGGGWSRPQSTSTSTSTSARGQSPAATGSAHPLRVVEDETPRGASRPGLWLRDLRQMRGSPHSVRSRMRTICSNPRWRAIWIGVTPLRSPRSRRAPAATRCRAVR